jgi:hypothetical protein
MGFDIPDEYDGYVQPDPEEVPKRLWHVAPQSARQSIEREGLSVDESRTHNTGGAYGDDTDWLVEDYGEGEVRTEWRPHGVYLFPTLSQALDYCQSGMDLWQVDSEDIEVIRDPSVALNWEHDDSHHAYVTEHVPARLIERMPGHELTAQRAERERQGGVRRPMLASLDLAPAHEHQTQPLPGLEL